MQDDPHDDVTHWTYMIERLLAERDAMIYGTGFIYKGRRVDPHLVFMEPK